VVKNVVTEQHIRHLTVEVARREVTMVRSVVVREDAVNIVSASVSNRDSEVVTLWVVVTGSMYEMFDGKGDYGWTDVGEVD
jgi:hypothetical protein